MQRASSTIRWKAATLLICLLALQVHFFAESGAAQKSPHDCQVCKTGACEIPTPAPSLSAIQPAAALLAELALPLVATQLSDPSAPRAPPQS
jgi:hypothetical protein